MVQPTRCLACPSRSACPIHHPLLTRAAALIIARRSRRSKTAEPTVLVMLAQPLTISSLDLEMYCKESRGLFDIVTARVRRGFALILGSQRAIYTIVKILCSLFFVFGSRAAGRKCAGVARAASRGPEGGAKGMATCRGSCAGPSAHAGLRKLTSTPIPPSCNLRVRARSIY